VGRLVESCGATAVRRVLLSLSIAQTFRVRARFDEAYQVFIMSVARKLLLSVHSRGAVEPAHDN
jgi:hypothetical protein